MAVISASTRAAIYGQPGHVELAKVVTPWGVTTYTHVLLRDLFLDACREAARCAWRPQRIDSYNPRPIRGYDGSSLSEWSLHSWGLAWDFFATPPNVSPPGGVWTPDNPVTKDFAACFTRRGFRWGATFSRVDLPHIEWPGARPAAHVSTREAFVALTDAEQAELLMRLRAMHIGNWVDPGSNQGDLTWLARILDEKLAPLSARLAALEAKVDGGGFDPGAIGDAVVDRLKDRL